MKKCLAFIALTVLSAAAAFANVELDLNYQAILADTYMLTKDVTRDSEGNIIAITPVDSRLAYILTAPLGLDLNVNIFFGSSPRKFEAGLHFGAGIAVPSEVTFDDEGTKTAFVQDLRESDPNGFVQAGGFGASFEIGPVFRFSINKTHQFSITPSIFFRFDALACRNSSEYIGFGDFAMGLDVDAGYKLWLVNKSGFHFGLNTGIGLELPTFATCVLEDGVDTPLTCIATEFGVKAYLGVCFNFGDRGVDR